jgi:aspartyl aminopeptidase
MVGKMNKKQIEDFKKQTVRKPKLVWDVLNDGQNKQVDQLAEDYKFFLNLAKTEREAVAAIMKKAEACGFENIDNAGNRSGKYYRVFRNKCIALAVAGKKPLSAGAKIIAAHIDSPRLDLKQNPLYEEVDLAFFKTHYYGGIRKYQWMATPLALHGKIVKADGSSMDFVIGEDESDPVFTVSDLLPHLARKVQSEKKLSEAFEGEKLNVLVGSRPLGGEAIEERFKLSVLQFFKEKYGVVEEDFTSAEIEVVPAAKARDIGLDRSMIGAYGQDDRICAFSALNAILEIDKPESWGLTFFFDKEEIGSDGNTGAKSHFVENFVSDLLFKNGEQDTDRNLRRVLLNSMAISADVNGALDPDYQEVHEKRNAARLGYGVCITKFTGSGGKYGSSDAGAEYLGTIRKIFNDNRIVWQTGELGKVDEGGGGTIAKFLAVYGMEIVDCGPALLSMHSPFEISSKADLFMVCKAYKAFLSSG